MNKGISGETTGELRKRFEKDVLWEKPDLLFLMGGSNDIFFEGTIEDAKINIQWMVEEADRNQIKVILGIPLSLCSENMADVWKPYASGKNVEEMLYTYQNWLRKAGSDWSVKLVDFPRIFPSDPKRQRKYYLDGIHVNAFGHKIMADAIYKIIKKYTKFY